jgi:hypothetical protein
MTTPKELADKARAYLFPYRIAPKDILLELRDQFHATIDQLQAMAEARQGSGELVATPWYQMSQHRRDFIARGESFVRSLYNDPKDDIRVVEVGAWIQYANQLLQRLPDSPPAQQATGKLTKPAKIGNGTFHVGVAERHVIEAAQRAYEHSQTPEGKAERAAEIERGAPFLAELQATGSGQVLTTPQTSEELSNLLAAALHLARQISQQITDQGRRLAAAAQAQPFAGFKVVVDPDMPADAMKLVAAQAQPEAECVKCVRCGHVNWIQEGKAPAQVAAPTTGKREPLRADVVLDMAERLRPLLKSAEDWEIVLAFGRDIERAHGITGEQR